MYLSHLLINVGDNPDRPRPGRLWLRNIYHVHQRLSMAFPSKEYRAADPHFLQPYDPAHFERPHFLFRIDNAIKDGAPRAVILVQSGLVPDWDYAFQNAPAILAGPPETREYNPAFQNGQRLRFRIRVNLSKKIKESKNGTDLRKVKGILDKKGRPKEQGKRVAFTWDQEKNPDDVIREWFSAKAGRWGFQIDEFRVIQLGWIIGYKAIGKHTLKFRSALLEGLLQVTDVEQFTTAIANGIGFAKSFGFGMLSVKEP